MWECDFRQQINKKEEISYLLNHSIFKNIPLNPRDAFNGGRTGNAVFHYKPKEGEKIKYIDVCSLYPFVWKYDKFPIGHPEVTVGHENCPQLDLHKIDVLINCDILPPYSLFHPVLPIMQNNKLMFNPCFTCSFETNQNVCTHSEEQKILTGTWAIDEVLKATEKDYKIIQIHEIWCYKVHQYDKTLNKTGLFTEMMDTFLKIKQEASGWPKECVCEQSKQKYVQEFFDQENIQLDAEKICQNAGLRHFAKIILNSFWGKFGQKENQPKTIIRNPAEFYTLMQTIHTVGQYPSLHHTKILKGVILI